MPFADDDYLDDDDEDIKRGYKTGKYMDRNRDMSSSSDLRAATRGDNSYLYDSDIIHNSIRQKIELEKWSSYSISLSHLKKYNFNYDFCFLC